MTQGLQVFDANGKLTVDITDSLARIIGTISIAVGTSGSVAVPAQAGGTRIFVVKLASTPVGPVSNGPSNRRTEVTISGNTISWTAGRDAVVLRYGVF